MHVPVDAVDIGQKVVSPLFEFDDHGTFLNEACHELLCPLSLRHMDGIRHKSQRPRARIHESDAQRGTHCGGLLPPHDSY